MTTIDISPESVEQLANRLHHQWYRQDAQLVLALSAALTQSRAETAAGIEASAILIAFHSGPIPFREEIARKIRAIATPDQTAALDKLIAEAVKPYVEALREIEMEYDPSDGGGNARSMYDIARTASKKGGQ